MDEWLNLLRAILYELQPIRFSQFIGGRSNNSNRNTSSSIKKEVLDFVQTTIIPFFKSIWSFGIQTLLPTCWRIVQNMTMKQWLIVAGVVAYYFVVRIIHEVLDAGPLVLITTALIGIFTIGLGDNEDDNQLSAYSVFNRGFQRLMGSVDVEELVNQHVGGGFAAGGGGGMMMMVPAEDPPDHQHDDNNRARQHQQRPANNNNDSDSDEDDEDDEDDDGDQANNNNNNNNNRSRKSGKKARRNKNKEQKLELRRQREAAMAMGLDGTGGEEELLAMQRLANMEGDQ